MSTRPGATSEPRVAAAIDRYYRAINAKDGDALAALIHAGPDAPKEH